MAANSDFKSTAGAYHLAGDRTGLYEVQRQNHYEVVIMDLGSIYRAGILPTTATNSDLISNAHEVIRLSVNSASIPNFTIQAITINRGNSSMKAAGKPTFGTGSINCEDYIGLQTKQALLAWQKLAYDPVTDKVGKMANYKKTIYLVEYTPDYEQVCYWEINGAWVSKVDEGQFSSDSGNKKQVSVTIEYDRAIPHLPDDVI